MYIYINNILKKKILINKYLKKFIIKYLILYK